MCYLFCVSYFVKIIASLSAALMFKLNPAEEKVATTYTKNDASQNH